MPENKETNDIHDGANDLKGGDTLCKTRQKKKKYKASSTTNKMVHTGDKKCTNALDDISS